MAHPNEMLIRTAYEAFNDGDIDGFLDAFSDEAALHSSEGSINGKEAIRSVLEQLRLLSGNTVRLDIHDVLANDDHTVVLQFTRASNDDRKLEDRVAYVFHIENGLVVDAWFQGDPRVQEDFYST